MGLLKTVFEVNLQLFQQQRGYPPTPFFPVDLISHNIHDMLIYPTIFSLCINFQDERESVADVCVAGSYWNDAAVEFIRDFEEGSCKYLG